MNNIFIDFDGTLIDVRLRLYSLFCSLSGVDMLSFEEYWEEKKKGKTQEDMLQEYTKFSNEERIQFAKQWSNKVEHINLLRKDIKQNFSEQLIEMAKTKGYVFLWTNRRIKKNLLEELQWLGWANKFDQILITEQRKSKYDLIMEILRDLGEDIHNLIITDTIEDYIIANRLKVDCLLYDGKTSNMAEYAQRNKLKVFENGQEIIQAIIKW